MKDLQDIVTGPPLKRLLLATTDDDLREVVHITLEGLLVHVVDAWDGPSALRLARESLPDLMLLEAQPNLDLATMLGALRDDPDTAEMPILLFLPPESRDDPARERADVCLDLPFDPPRLEQLVQALLRSVEQTLPADRTQ